MKSVLRIFNKSQGVVPPGVYILQNTMARGGEMVPGKKMKNEAVRNKMKKKEKGKKEKGERGKEKEEKEKGEKYFFVNIWHTSIDHCILK